MAQERNPPLTQAEPMTQTEPITQAEPIAARSPNPFFDEDVRLNPMMSLSAFQAATPLFRRQYHQFAQREIALRKGKKPRRRGLLRAFLYFLFSWGLGLFLVGGADILSGQIDEATLVEEVILSFLLVAGFSLLITLLSDALMELFCLSLRNHRDAEWDLVQLTPLSKRGIAVAVYGSVRLYYRRMWVNIFNTRLVILYSTILMAGALGYLLTRYVGANFEYFFEYVFNDHIAQLYVVILILIAAAVILLLEMRWRWGGMTALGAALAFGLSETVLALPIRFGVWILSIVLQVGVCLLSWSLSEMILDWLLARQATIRLFGDRDGLGIDPTLLQVLFAVILGGILFYIYFRLIRFVGLRIAYYAILHGDGG